MSYDYDIRELPVGTDFCRVSIEKFLAQNSLRMDALDAYVGIFDAQDNMIAGGGLSGNVIKCIAVDAHHRGEGLLAVLVSRLQSMAATSGYTTTLVYTKPENVLLFRDMGYVLLGEAPEAVLMESSSIRLDRQKREWKRLTESIRSSANLLQVAHLYPCGICVINANPFTRGHLHLVETAASQCCRLAVIVVSEDVSAFSFSERFAMTYLGVSHLKNVVVLPSGPYAISAATFPAYFLKEATTVSEIQMRLDADIFCRHIAPTLAASVRFVGSEPYDALTHRYNEILDEELKRWNLKLVEIPRIGNISASRVRSGAWNDVPSTSLPFLMSYYACEALRDELDLTPKPGLVDRDDNGAHRNMNCQLMRRSIDALRPHFRKISEIVLHNSLLAADELYALLLTAGHEAEQEMLTATGGVNTHGGALFSLGLVVSAFMQLYTAGSLDGISDFPTFRERLQEEVSRLATHHHVPSVTHGSQVRQRYPHVGGALAGALAGFPVGMKASRPQESASSWHSSMEVMLEIMSQLDDTNILYRSDMETLRSVQHEAARLLRVGFTEPDIRALNARFSERGISPGGSADMYALSVLVSILSAPFV